MSKKDRNKKIINDKKSDSNVDEISDNDFSEYRIIIN